MKQTLHLSFRWYERSEDGILRKPKTGWGDPHPLSREYATREEAIGDYCRYVNMDKVYDYPHQMILVEEHTVGIDWDE